MYLIEVTKASRELDLYHERDTLVGATIYVAQEAFGPDGYRIFEFEPLDNLDGFTLPEVEGAAFYLRAQTELEDLADQSFTTKEEVMAARDALHASDGYLIFAAWDGDGGSPRLESRVCLWQRAAVVVDSKENEHGRNDGDRF